MVVRVEFEKFPAKAGRSPRVNLVDLSVGRHTFHDVALLTVTNERERWLRNSRTDCLARNGQRFPKSLEDNYFISYWKS